MEFLKGSSWTGFIPIRGVGKDARKELSVLELLEQTVVEGDELGEILEIIRGKVQANEIDKDNFAQIYAEITKSKQAVHWK